MTPEQVIAEIRARLPDSVPMRSARVDIGVVKIGPSEDRVWIGSFRDGRLEMNRGCGPDREGLVIRGADRLCAAARALGWL